MAPQPLLILFVDAFAYDYLAKRPLLPDFWQEMLPIETLLGYSSSLVPSLWSGRLPDQLNFWNEFKYQPRKPYRLIRFIDLFPHQYIRNLLRLLLFRYGTKYYPNILPTIPTRVEAYFGRSLVNYHQLPPIPLGEYGIDSRLKKLGIPYHFSYPYRKFEADVFITDLKIELETAQVFIYGTATVDTLGHISGPNPLEFEEVIIEIETFIKRAHALLSTKGSPTIILISDHGMTPVNEKFDLIGWLKPWQLGEEYLVFLDATMARFWNVGTLPLKQVMRRLMESNQGRFLNQRDRDYYGLNFGNNRFGDEIFLLKPGHIFDPSFMDSPNLPLVKHETKGMHGYEPLQDSSTRAVFLFHGPTPLPFIPHRLIDVIDLLERLFISSLGN